jgi:hypothetical protein
VQAGAPDPADYYFDIADSNVVQTKHVREIERDLQPLDNVAWEVLKRDLIPLVTKRHRKRGWQQLLDKLNEAKGYNYLVGIGCTQVEFIPRSSSQTPDLKARLGSKLVLCEVKTLNTSDVEVECRKNGGVRSILTELPLGFVKKLTATLETARKQMMAYCPDAEPEKILFLVVNYDDILHEYAENYSAQLEEFVATRPLQDLRIEFHIKPPFYWSTRIMEHRDKTEGEVVKDVASIPRL